MFQNIVAQQLCSQSHIIVWGPGGGAKTVLLRLQNIKPLPDVERFKDKPSSKKIFPSDDRWGKRHETYSQRRKNLMLRLQREAQKCCYIFDQYNESKGGLIPVRDATHWWLFCPTISCLPVITRFSRTWVWLWVCSRNRHREVRLCCHLETFS